MPVTPTYPGVYVEELPSLVHSVQAAPTSIAVFVGYTHPFLTPAKSQDVPIQLFSFADYQTNFGGFVSSPWQPDYVGNAVYQFFLNGGSTCYVVSLPVGNYWGVSGGSPHDEGVAVAAATANIVTGAETLTATALQPVGVPGPSGGTVGIPMQLKLSNLKSSDPAGHPTWTDVADVVVSYGSRVETYRGLAIGNAVSAFAASKLCNLTASVTAPANWPTTGSPFDFNYGTLDPAQADIIVGHISTDQTLTATALHGVGATPMTISVSNLDAAKDKADVVVTWGSQVETYPQLSIGSAVATFASQSKLCTLAETNGPTEWPTTGSPFTFSYYATGSSPPDTSWSVIDGTGTPFVDVFAAGAPLDKVPIFNLLVTPGITSTAVQSAALAYAEHKRAFYIMDTPSSSPAGAATDWDVDDLVENIGTTYEAQFGPVVSPNAALYYPWLQITDPLTGGTTLSPPSGFVAGMYGQEDTNQGVWKSPAGIETSLLGTPGVDPNGFMTDMQQGVLNQNALNCIRQLPGAGTVIFGARTTAGADANTAQQQWRYVAVRRMALFIEQSLYQSLNWAVFQGNSQPLWDALAQETRAFMLSLFRQGAFAGTTPKDAFLVQCDSTTTTPTDVANGVVNLLVGFAPLVPAEFVVIQIAQLAGQAQS